jgi:hypothetical protein
MSIRTKKSFAWLWIAALLSSTVGLSLHTIYCYCTGDTTVSFFELAADPCRAKRRGESSLCRAEKAGPKKSCCASKDGDLAFEAVPKKEQTATCCARNGAAHLAGDDQGCTQKSTVVFQLKTEFLVEKPFQKDFEFPLWLEQMPFLKRLARPALCEAPRLFSVAESPPPESGRFRCVRHQCFLC